MKKIVALGAFLLPSLLLANTGTVESKLPFAPEAGKCYTRVVVPAKYKFAQQKILVKAESFKLKTMPAKYAFESQEVLVKEASERSVIVPAKYKTIKERVLLEDEKRSLYTVPARYKVVNKKILVKPAGFEWTKGKGPLQKIDHTTGEILCYKKTPAVYKTITEKVIVSEASVKETVTPAKYGYVTKRVLVDSEKIIKKTIPEVYKTIRVKKMVKEPYQVKVTQPAKYRMVSKNILTDDSSTEWRSILCETNATKAKISLLQRRLTKLGYYKGPIDGVYGKATFKAVSKYQRKHKLASGGLTEETLERLRITL